MIMPNNSKSLKVDDINKQKETLQSDLEKVQGQLQNVDKAKVQLQSQIVALNGAIQQCDLFLQQLGEANPASSIPSQDNNAVTEALS
tara:strand:- start:390 stop:650 length:261 start_codon:yes stop_codon:yes gene_type:complete